VGFHVLGQHVLFLQLQFFKVRADTSAKARRAVPPFLRVYLKAPEAPFTYEENDLVVDGEDVL